MVRQRGINDCMVAAFATVCGLTYEVTAAAFGYPCEPQSAAPIPVFKGIHAVEIALPLFKLGFSSTLVATAEGSPTSGLSLPSSSQVKEALPGRPAVLFIADPLLQSAVFHALAWDGERAADCRSGETVNLESLALSGAVFIDRQVSASPGGKR